MADEEGRRPRRRAAKRSAAPSAVHYVGYVEDDETPEMIMKKFEELEKVKAAAVASVADRQEEATGEGSISDKPAEEAVAERPKDSDNTLAGLTDAQLLEVFKQTSIFNVRSALAGNEALLDDGETEEGMDRWSDDDASDTEGLWNDVRGFWSDDEDGESSGRWRKGKSRAGKREPRTRGMTHARQRHDIVTHYNAATQALIRRKVRVVDKDALLHIKIPLPLPLSWGRQVKPFVPLEIRNGERCPEGNENCDNNATEQPSTCWEVENVVGCEWGGLKRNFQGVLINPGWEVPEAAGSETVAKLAKIPIPRLCPVGFIFIWVAKQHVSAVVTQMSRWGYVYIENLTWVFLHANNSILKLPSQYVQSSHLTLYMFRKDGQGKDIELRHQRNPDVIFDCIRSSGHGGGFEVPEEAYVAIETLLPTGKGKFLELWAQQDACRLGWMRITERARRLAK